VFDRDYEWSNDRAGATMLIRKEESPPMRRSLIFLFAIAQLALNAPRAAGALIPLGATAPDLTRYDLSGVPHSISGNSGRVIVLFLLGWN
jgi:hypothetical protein